MMVVTAVLKKLALPYFVTSEHAGDAVKFTPPLCYIWTEGNSDTLRLR